MSDSADPQDVRIDVEMTIDGYGPLTVTYEEYVGFVAELAMGTQFLQIHATDQKVHQFVRPTQMQAWLVDAETLSPGTPEAKAIWEVGPMFESVAKRH
ncbi:MAG TPA: hypothetical protein DDY88_07160 [Actinobacteria bacterium]|nr:hypothetical protein [Actinomycetota bacterium]